MKDKEGLPIPPISSRPKLKPCKLDLMGSYTDSLMNLDGSQILELDKPLFNRKEVKNGDKKTRR